MRLNVLKKISLTGAALALTAPAFAQTATTSTDCTDSGVWFGKVGKAAVSMAFSDDAGRYYYGSGTFDLVLARDPAQPNNVHCSEAGTAAAIIGNCQPGVGQDPIASSAIATPGNRCPPVPPPAIRSRIATLVPHEVGAAIS